MSAASVITRPIRPTENRAEADLIARAFAAGPYGHLQISEERRAFQRDSAGRAESGEVLVAVDLDGVVLGSASALRAGTRYTRVAREGEAEIRLLAVEPNQQGRGIAAALMNAALETTAGWGADALVLDTGSLNTRAQELYERLGFQRMPDRESALSDQTIAPLVYTHPLQQGDAVRVRLMRSDEATAVSALLDAAYSHDYELPPDYRANIIAVDERARDHQVWVAEDRASGRLVATVATPRPGGAISELARPGELDFRLLAVDPLARRSGLGELLTRHVLAIGRLRGAARVVMNSGPEMRGAHRLYERMGFARLGDREPLITRPDGSSFRLLTFGYDLTAAA